MSLYNDGKAFDDISATTGQFPLGGGRYGIVVHGTWGGGSATLETLAGDGLTFVPCATAFTADGTALVDLPPGVYQWVIATATALYLTITRAPL